MKQFILFGSETYYATGGFHDFLSSHATLDEAVAAARTAMNTERPSDAIEWWHVYDSQAGIVVKVSETCPYGAPDPWPIGLAKREGQ